MLAWLGLLAFAGQVDLTRPRVELLRSAAPVYPAEAVELGLGDALCTMRLWVDKAGRLDRASAEGCVGPFAKSMRKALKRFSWAPAIVGERAWPFQQRLTVRFTGPQSAGKDVASAPWADSSHVAPTAPPGTSRVQTPVLLAPPESWLRKRPEAETCLATLQLDTRGRVTHRSVSGCADVLAIEVHASVAGWAFEAPAAPMTVTVPIRFSPQGRVTAPAALFADQTASALAVHATDAPNADAPPTEVPTVELDKVHARVWVRLSYPHQAMTAEYVQRHGVRQRVECHVELTVDPHGDAHTARFIGECPDPFDDHVLASFEAWQLRPIRVDGERSWVRFSVPVVYERVNTQVGVAFPPSMLTVGAQMLFAP